MQEGLDDRTPGAHEWVRADDAKSTPEDMFALFMAKERMRRGWSQQKLADRLTEIGLPIHSTAITRMERGERSIRLNEAVLICGAFGVSMHQAVHFMRNLYHHAAVAPSDPPSSLAEAVDVASAMVHSLQQMLNAAASEHYAVEQARRVGPAAERQDDDA